MRINGPALAEIMERSGFSPSDFAVEVGISPQYLADMIAGRKPGSPKVIHRMREVLKCRLPAIIRDPGAAA